MGKYYDSDIQILNQFAKRLEELREQKGVSRIDLCRAIDVSVVSYTSWEKALRTPNVTMCIKLADYLGVTVDYLLGMSDDLSIVQTNDVVNTYLVEISRNIDTCKGKCGPLYLTQTKCCLNCPNATISIIGKEDDF